MPELAEAALPELGAETGAAVEQPITDTGGDSQSPDTGTQPEESGQDPTQAGTDAQRGADEAQAQEDGRTIPPDLRKHFSELKAQNPALYKKLKGLFFAEREFRSHFPGGPQEAVKLKEFVETIGGEEGWNGLQESLKDRQDLDSLYSKGDPQFVEKLSQSDPQAFGQMMPKGLEKWAELDKSGYDHVMARVLVNTLGTSPIAEIYRALSADEKTKALAEKLGSWFNGMEDLAQKVPQKQVDPERKKLEQEKAQWEEQKQSEFRDKVGSQMQQFYVHNIETHLGNEFKARNRNLSQLKKGDEETYWAMVNDSYSRIRQVLQKDQTFVSKFESLLKSGNGDAAVKLAKSRADRIMAEVAQKTYKVFNVGTTTAQRKEQALTNQQRTTVPPTTKLSQKPEPSQIDWNRTDSGMIMDGKAYLKGRKEQVTF